MRYTQKTLAFCGVSGCYFLQKVCTLKILVLWGLFFKIKYVKYKGEYGHFHATICAKGTYRLSCCQLSLQINEVYCPEYFIEEGSSF